MLSADAVLRYGYIALTLGFGLVLILLNGLYFKHCVAFTKDVPPWAFVYGCLLLSIGVTGVVNQYRPGSHALNIQFVLGLPTFFVWLYGQVVLFGCFGKCPKTCFIHFFRAALGSIFMPYVYFLAYLTVGAARWVAHKKKVAVTYDLVR